MQTVFTAHCGALMLVFFYGGMKPLLEQGRVELVRPPVGEVTNSEAQETRYAYADAHFLSMCALAKTQSTVKFHTLKYLSLAGIESSKLEQLCINPRTRKTSVMGPIDAELGIEIFGLA